MNNNAPPGASQKKQYFSTAFRIATPALRPSPIRMTSEGPQKQTSPVHVDRAPAFDPPHRIALARASETGSVHSTESVITIKGTPAAQTPSAFPLRTPSYPFPRMVTPRDAPSSDTRTFMGLSPTKELLTGTKILRTCRNIRETWAPPDPGTPPSTLTFAPAGTGSSPKDSIYSTPDTYAATLLLNSELGIQAWWKNVVHVMYEQYKAERATLSIPGDPTDLENVPWSQKATFDVLGGGHGFQSSQETDRTDVTLEQSGTEISTATPTKNANSRPRLANRHSHIGIFPTPSSPVEPQRSNRHPSSPSRPLSPLAVRNRQPELRSHTLRHPSSGRKISKVRSTNESEQHIPSLDWSEEPRRDPRAQVFDNPRSLEQEVEPLIDRHTVVKVFGKDKPVVLTREYQENLNLEVELEGPKRDRASVVKNVEKHVAVLPLGDSNPFPLSSSRVGGSATAPLNVSHNIDGKPRGIMVRKYDEYEQMPQSPWSQSPAPSPAIPSDPDHNPFFVPPKVDEEAFASSPPPHNYSQEKQVQAIGVDHANTIVHIPLFRPVLPKLMTPGFSNSTALCSVVDDKENDAIHSQIDGSTYSVRRKNPVVAIISILTPVIPYPTNLRHSLTYLLPHLATSYASAVQYSRLERQLAVGPVRRHHAIGGVFSSADQELETLAHLRGNLYSPSPDPVGSVSGSITSPSEFSGVSKFSPLVSPAVTPGWDPNFAAYANERRSPGIISSNEGTDSYFSARSQLGPNSSPRPLLRLRDGSASPSSLSEARLAARNQGQVVRDESLSLGNVPEQQCHCLEGILEGSDVSMTANPQGSTTEVGLKVEGGNVIEQISGAGRELKLSDRRDYNKIVVQPSVHTQIDPTLHSHGVGVRAPFPVLPSTAVPLPGPHDQASTASIQAVISSNNTFPPPTERLARQMLDFLPMQIFLASPEDGKLIWVNAKFIAYRDQSASEIFADPWGNIHPSQQKAFAEAWARAMENGDQFSITVRLRRFNDENDYRWFHVRANTMLNQQGELVHWIGTLTDIHQQHEAEEEARRERDTAASESRYRAIANAGPQIMFAADPEKGLIFTNTRWQAYSGQTVHDAVHFGFAEYVHPEDLKKCIFFAMRSQPMHKEASLTSASPHLSDQQPLPIADVRSASSSETTISPETVGPECFASAEMPSLKELVKQGIVQLDQDDKGEITYSTEMRLRSGKGEYRWHLIHLKHVDPIDFGNGEASWIGSCIDVNKTRVLEQQLSETMKDKARFLSTMSHELRTPLHGMLGLLPFLLESNLNAEQKSMMENLNSSAVTLKHLLDNYMDLQKVEAGAMKISYNWFHIRSLLEQVNSLNSPQAIDKGLELNYLVDDDVPPEVKGDKVRVNQVLTNIVGNAIKFTDHGEIYVRCSVIHDKDVALESPEVMLMFEVVDTGRGFSKSQATLLFKTFSQIEGSDTRQQRGSGLGLVISRQLAELHGGSLTASSVPDKGSTFLFKAKFRLPSEGDEPPSDLPAVAEHPSLSGHPQHDFQNGKQSSAVMAKHTSHSSTLFSLRHSHTPSSPVIGSSASSDPSVRSLQTQNSEISSAFSIMKDEEVARVDQEAKTQMGVEKNYPPSPVLNLMDPKSPSNAQGHSKPKLASVSPSSLQPPMYSILIICPLLHTRMATEQHVRQILPSSIPHQLTAMDDLDQCEKLIFGENPVLFTHIVLNIQDVHMILALTERILSLNPQPSVILITDHVQKQKVSECKSGYNNIRRNFDSKVLFVFRPLTPHKFAFIFDPAKERDLSTDRNRNNAQRANATMKSEFKAVSNAVKDRNFKILLVEDNATNLMVIRKYLDRVEIPTETALDGQQCVDMVFSHPPGYYSLIVCDIQMPIKDGYATCREIRAWETVHHYSQVPIIALSANVMTESLDEAAAAGFHDYLTKPVSFTDLGQKLINLLDPETPNILLKDRKVSPDDVTS